MGRIDFVKFFNEHMNICTLSKAVIKKYATDIDAYQYSHIKKWSENRRN